MEPQCLLGLWGFPLKLQGLLGLPAASLPSPLHYAANLPHWCFWSTFPRPCVTPEKASIRARLFGVRLAIKAQDIVPLSSRSGWLVFGGSGREQSCGKGLQLTGWYHCISKMQWWGQIGILAICSLRQRCRISTSGSFPPSLILPYIDMWCEMWCDVKREIALFLYLFGSCNLCLILKENQHYI